MQKIFLSLFLMSVSIVVNAQENCGNAIDDDFDGLIDMNDPDCTCNGFGVSLGVTSLIPNPSFEDTLCCPTYFTQLICADSWIQASNATSDYLNLCGFMGPTNTSPDLPLPGAPGGSGYGGFYNNNNWKENIGACLNAPMTAGTNYTMDFYLAWSKGYQTLDATLYGTPNCGELPWNTSTCPIGSGSWMVLGSTTITFPPNNSWQHVTINFTPTANIDAISIGAPCGGQVSGSNYYFIDELTLATSSSFNSENITESGDWCDNDLILTATTSSGTNGGSWQWFEDGIALVGETNNVLDMMVYGAGNYTVVYTVGSDCGSADYTLTVPPIPVSAFTTANQCDGTPIDFTDNSTILAPGSIVNWAWDFGDGNTANVQHPSHTYASDGTYNVSLAVTDNNGCTKTSTQTVTVHPNPMATFTVPDACIGIDAVFTNTSSINSGNISSWAWDFGDGNTSTLQDPIHTYASSGTYQVSLIALSDLGCSDTIVGTTTVHPIPLPDFTVADVCVYDQITVTDNSTVAPPDNLTNWSWDFGDGNSTNGATANHSYATYGTYDILMTTTSNSGCSASISKSVTIHAQPIADFAVPDGCIGADAVFTNTSSINSGNISSWAWDFGDGNTSTLQDPIHTYASSGTYNVSLVALSDQGCSDTIVGTTTVHPIPLPDFTVADVCVYDQITVTDNSTVAPPDNLTNWSWDFGDGNSANGSTANHSYATYGTYDILMTTTSNSGCSASISKSVTIHAQPLPDFQWDDICINTPPTTFVDMSSIAAGNLIVSWDWDFGDGTTGSGQGTTHSYHTEGALTVKLITTSDVGCVDSITQTVTVFEKPTAAFTSNLTRICSPGQIQFTDLSTTNTATITVWQWNFFGGAGETTAQDPLVHYSTTNSTPEFYDVQLIATNSLGCKDTITVSNYIEVLPSPKAQFTATPQVLTLAAPETQFNNGSINSDEWEWDFGDNSSGSIVENPAHAYLNAEPDDTYTTQLIAYNYGKMCSDTAYGLIEVQDILLFYVPNVFTPDGDLFNETWKPIFSSGYDPFDFHLMVFNRWGELIWESYDATYGWNGHYANGDLVEDGTYIWMIDFAETMSDKRHLHRGHLTVLK